MSPTGPRPDLLVGDVVTVAEPGLVPWRGEVLSVKPGSTCWYVEVRDEDRVAWVVPAKYVTHHG